MEDEEVRQAVRDRYGRIALQGNSCCGPATSCGGGHPQDTVSRAIGYSAEEIGAVPDGANLGLGCGNPIALASLKEGEVVLDLGSGAGFDSFLAAARVGQSGSVIGVDMTPEMLEKARANLRKGGHTNVDFRLGEIENLPVADGSVDVVISNCVINLSPDKDRVFREAYRVLKPGGRIMISDITLLKELPEPIRQSVAAYVGCIAGAALKNEYLQAVAAAGFEGVEVVDETSARGLYDGAGAAALAREFGLSAGLVEAVADSIVSIKVQAFKPR